MKARRPDNLLLAAGDRRVRDAVVEVPILLESRLVAALETAACAQGMTVGNMVRCLLRDLLSSSGDERSVIPSRLARTVRTND